MKYYTIIEDIENGKYLHLDIRWRISWVKDKKNATPLENNEFYSDWINKKGLTDFNYIFHRSDKNGNFI